jgi:cytosine/adenosine deaminase-related metal-dependent hydrolase
LSIGLRKLVRGAIHHDQDRNAHRRQGWLERNVVVSVEGSKITRIELVGAARPTYDLSTLTVMPGWIDTHSHPNTHFDKNNGCVADRPEVVW